MARSKKRLIVNITNSAAGSLAAIWGWNLEKYGPERARRYLDFLVNKIKKLDVDYMKCEGILDYPNLRFLLVKRRANAHGHIVVFRYDHDAVQVLKIFHTAEDWQTKVAELD